MENRKISKLEQKAIVSDSLSKDCEDCPVKAFCFAEIGRHIDDHEYQSKIGPHCSKRYRSAYMKGYKQALKDMKGNKK